MCRVQPDAPRACDHASSARGGRAPGLFRCLARRSAPHGDGLCRNDPPRPRWLCGKHPHDSHHRCTHTASVGPPPAPCRGNRHARHHVGRALPLERLCRAASRCRCSNTLRGATRDRTPGAHWQALLLRGRVLPDPRARVPSRPGIATSPTAHRVARGGGPSPERRRSTSRLSARRHSSGRRRRDRSRGESRRRTAGRRALCSRRTGRCTRESRSRARTSRDSRSGCRRSPAHRA